MDGGGSTQYNPRTVEEVFRDFKGRRAGMIRALTTDVEDFYQQCDPEKENLCLYGFPNEHWEVALPAEEVPPELPEPALGINFARDGMQEKDWLSLVAVHSDAWLLAVAFYFGARFGFDKAERWIQCSVRYTNLRTVALRMRVRNIETASPCGGKTAYILIVPRRCKYGSLVALAFLFIKRLFGMINDLPTIYEVVNGKNKVRTSGTNNSTTKSKLNTKVRASEPPVNKHTKAVSQPKEEDDDEGPAEEEGDDDGAAEGEEEHGETLCGACGDNYASDEFWICCDVCEKWFHGKCVKITPARAEHIKQYKCPSCSTSSKRARPS